MSREGLASVARSIDEVKQVITSLSDEEWARPSGCTGWTVRDLVAHMSSNYKETVDPSPPPPEPLNLPAERLMDLLVDIRDGWTHEQIRDEYLQYCDAALATLGALQDEPLASTVIPLADLGSYPMHQLADAYAFDHYCHLRVDLLAPHRPDRARLAAHRRRARRPGDRLDAGRHPADAARPRAAAHGPDPARAHRRRRRHLGHRP